MKACPDLFSGRSAKNFWSLKAVVLKENHVRYDQIIFGAGEGERIMINDNKPDGLVTTYGISTKRDRFCRTRFVTDHSLGTMYD